MATLPKELVGGPVVDAVLAGELGNRRSAVVALATTASISPSLRRSHSRQTRSVLGSVGSSCRSALRAVQSSDSRFGEQLRGVRVGVQKVHQTCFIHTSGHKTTAGFLITSGPPDQHVRATPAAPGAPLARRDTVIDASSPRRRRARPGHASRCLT